MKKNMQSDTWHGKINHQTKYYVNLWFKLNEWKINRSGSEIILIYSIKN